MLAEAPIFVRDVLRLLMAADSYPRLGNHDWREGDQPTQLVAALEYRPSVQVLRLITFFRASLSWRDRAEPSQRLSGDRAG